jgi:hypothetical protein
MAEVISETLKGWPDILFKPMAGIKYWLLIKVTS